MDEDNVRQRMDRVIGDITSEVSSVRSGKATPGVVSDIVVTAYGGSQRLKVMELATVTATDSATIVIEPWDKSIMGDIKKGIELTNVGLTPVVDGEIIRINIPALTAEDREKLAKMISVKIENAKIAIRQIRGDVMKDIKDSYEKKETTEDEKFANEKKLQEITDEYVDRIDALGTKKKDELLTL